MVVPQLRERFFEQIGGVQALVGGEQELQVLARIAVQVLRMRQQGVLLSFDVRAILARQPGVLLLSDLSSASLRCRSTWNLSNRIAACGALLDLQLKVDAIARTGQIPHSSLRAVLPPKCTVTQAPQIVFSPPEPV